MRSWDSKQERRTASELVRRSPPRAQVKPIAIECARMAREGKSNAEIAEKLGITAVREEGIPL